MTLPRHAAKMRHPVDAEAAPLNILHIGKYFAPFRGGVETYLLDAITAQAAGGHACLALVHNHERSPRLTKERHGDDDSGWAVWRTGTWMTAFFTPLSPGFRGNLREALRAFKPDVIHAHLPNPSACWLLSLPAARDIPLVLHWHSDVHTDGQGPAMRALYRLYRPLEKRLLDRADAIIATSASYLETSESLQAYPEKCHVVPLGLDARRVLAHARDGAAREDAPDDPPDARRPFRVLAIGRLTYYKGFGFLIRALAELQNVELHIVGEGALRGELWKLARELKVARHVTFHGGLDDPALAAQLEACDCVCLPSTERTEAFGLVLLEAMAFGKPTVSSRVQGSGMSWVVKDGETGLKVPPRNVAALADALDRLHRDPALARRLGAAGRARFHERFAIEPSVAALQAVYDQVTGA